MTNHGTLGTGPHRTLRGPIEAQGLDPQPGPLDLYTHLFTYKGGPLWELGGFRRVSCINDEFRDGRLLRLPRQMTFCQCDMWRRQNLLWQHRHVVSAETTSVESADKTSGVTADKTSVVSPDTTSVVSADKTSAVSQDIPVLWRTKGAAEGGPLCSP